MISIPIWVFVVLCLVAGVVVIGLGIIGGVFIYLDRENYKRKEAYKRGELQ